MSPGRTLLVSHVNQAVKKCPSRHDECAALDDAAVFHRKTNHSITLDEDLASFLKDPLNVGLLPDLGGDPRPVQPFIRLGARRPHRGATAAIEQFELNARRVNRAPHQATERIDLANQMPLRGPTDRGVTWHMRDRLE